MVAFCLAACVPASARTGGCPTRTGEDATLFVPAEALDPDALLEAGDVLRAYGSGGDCLGEAVWTGGEGVALALWGDDVETSAPDGALPGEAFELRALRGGEETSLGVSFEAVLSAPAGTGAEYHPGAIYLVDGLWSTAPTAGEGLPEGFRLGEVHPNPAVYRAEVTLELARAQHVTVTVYDALGRSVGRLHEGPLDGGRVHRFSTEDARLASGTYFFRVDGEDFGAIRRFTLLR